MRTKARRRAYPSSSAISDGDDIKQFFAQKGEYTPGGFWRLTGVLLITYNPVGGVGESKNYQQLDTDITTPPKQISLVLSQPEQLTVSQLTQYLNTSTSNPENMAKYRTEWWYRMFYPLSVLVLMIFGLMQGGRTDRRDAAAGVFKTIVVLLLYMFFSNLMLQMGNPRQAAAVRGGHCRAIHLRRHRLGPARRQVRLVVAGDGLL